MKYRSEFRFTLRNSDFINAVVEIVDGSLDLAVGVGIKFDRTFQPNSRKYNLTHLIQLHLTTNCSKEIFST
jgi:hypothetical protein